MASSSMCGACNMAATRRAMVVLPEQLGPMITTRSNLIRAHDQRSASPSDAIGEGGPASAKQVHEDPGLV